MKYTIFYSILFLFFTFHVGFAQISNKQIVAQTIDRINIEIAKQYIEENGVNFPSDIKNSTKLIEYLEKMYKEPKHPLRFAVSNLNYKAMQYENEDITDFLTKAVTEYVIKIPYDKEKIKDIIAETKNLTKENSETESTKLDSVEQVKKELEKQQQENEKLKKQLSEKQEGMTTTPNLSWADFLLYFLIAFVVLGVFFIIWLFWQSNHRNNSPVLIPNNRVENPIENKITENKTQESVSPKPKTKNKIQGNWLVVGASAIGKSHLQSNPPIPCQDSHYYQTIGNGWGIAVSCDGAGSAKNSHLGSKFIAQQAVELFKYIVEENRWHIENKLPPEKGWQALSKKAFAKLRYDLEEYAKREGFRTESLACTAIVVIYSPIGLLVTHIGDGRAAYCDQNHDWFSIIEPHKGEEANHTIFLTSNIGLFDDKEFIYNDLLVPESRVINAIPSAFTLMSDGCENHAFELSRFDEKNQKYTPLNNPYPKFFNPLLESLKGMYQNKLSDEEIKAKWEKFIEGGNEGLKNEPDDKTMILGIFH